MLIILKLLPGLLLSNYMIPANVYKTGTAEDGQIMNGAKMEDSHLQRNLDTSFVTLVGFAGLHES
jgi:hypothetical protein